MAIRFKCPSCHQPIEVDDVDAGSDVLCYYCRSAVKVPSQSQSAVDTGGMKVATPAGAELRHISEGSPSPEQIDAVFAKPKSKLYGVLGLLSVIAAAVLMIIVAGWMARETLPEMQQIIEQNMSQKELMEILKNKQQEMMEKMPTGVQLCTIGFPIFGIIGLILSIVGVVKNSGRPYAIVALIGIGLFILLLLASASMRGAA